VSAFIVGSGSALPDTVVSNEEIAERLGLDAEQIFKSSGIQRRRWQLQELPQVHSRPRHFTLQLLMLKFPLPTSII
jgi:3-oxoacyl-[acyl-carrier-protein] synthase III